MKIPEAMHQRTFLERLWGLRDWRVFTSVMLRRLHVSHLFVMNAAGVKLRFYPAVWSWNLWLNREAFRDDVEFLRRWLREGEVVVDCGANVGFLALIAGSAVGPKGRVFAFEPHPRIFAYLLGNLALNRTANIDASRVAVGASDGTIAFTDQYADDGNHVAVGEDAKISVPVRPLDDLVGEMKQGVSFLKLDVEGYELFVLRGGKKTLAVTQCVYFESSKELFARYGYQCRDILELLADSGFSLYRRTSRETVAAIGVDYVSTNIENLIAIRDARALEKRVGFIVHGMSR